MKHTALFSLVLMLAPHVASAADHDMQLWTEAGVRLDINKKLRLKFDQHFRLHRDISDPKSIMPELAISYRVLKFLSLEAGYRAVFEFYQQTDDPSWYASDWHRFFADVRLRLRFKPVTLRYRLRFQEQYGWNWVDNAKEYEHKLTIRNKILAEVRYPYGFRQFLAVELFNRLRDSVRAWHKLRTTFGLRYVVNSNEFTLAYRLEVYLFDDPNGQTTRNFGDMNHIIGLGYHFRF